MPSFRHCSYKGGFQFHIRQWDVLWRWHKSQVTVESAETFGKLTNGQFSLPGRPHFLSGGICGARDEIFVTKGVDDVGDKCIVDSTVANVGVDNFQGSLSNDRAKVSQFTDWRRHVETKEQIIQGKAKF